MPQGLTPLTEQERFGSAPRTVNYSRSAKRTRRLHESRRRRRRLSRKQRREHLRNTPVSISKLRAACGATRHSSLTQRQRRWEAVRLGLCPGVVNDYIYPSPNNN
jgi:hypothetical protein